MNSLPLTEPKLSTINASVPMLDEYEGNWVAWHKDHQAVEFVMYRDLDDETRNDSWEADLATEYPVRCCGEDRPVHKDGLTVQVKPAAGKEFVTIHDYVSGMLSAGILYCSRLIGLVVHPWIMSLREHDIQAMTVAGDGTSMRPESARAMDWKISVRDAQQHYILTHKMWLSDPTKPVPLDDATRRKLRAAGTSRDWTRP